MKMVGEFLRHWRIDGPYDPDVAKVVLQMEKWAHESRQEQQGLSRINTPETIADRRRLLIEKKRKAGKE
jgi:hypothetical protein